ncbi:MAG: pyridoxal phosphate-dependent aminotransferase, partial [Spirochaetes bacterium]|nr:pyridoxal phosphate-dependent aminotransferase [Spirochaetota bacterium]
MKYNFDEIINRKNSGGIKWDLVEYFYKDPEVLPFWVADMDFACALPIIQAIQKRLEHPIFGYTLQTEEYNDAVLQWMKTRHHWNIKRNWIVFTPGIVPALNLLIRTFTHPGEKVIIQTPVYHIFFQAVRNNGCSVIENQLVLSDHQYQMDFDLLEKQIDKRTRMLILCSPQNPVGRVWAEKDLLRLFEICQKHNLLIVADEIHHDLIMPGYQHKVMASLSDEIADQIITCCAPSKTFNLAGLQTANLIIKDKHLRNQFKIALDNLGITGPNPLSQTALIAAYTKGAEWLDQVLVYIHNNYLFLKKYLKTEIPELRVLPLQATYLCWIDCSALNMNDQQIKLFFQDNAKVGIEEGYRFGS